MTIHDRRQYSLTLLAQALALGAFSSLAAATDLTVPNAASISLAAGTYNYDNVLIQSGGTLRPYGAVKIYANTFTLANGGSIDGAGLGWQGSSTAGAGPGGGYTTGDGGAHGGNAYSAYPHYSLAYDSVAMPLLSGSAGGPNTASVPGGAGGAALWVSATGAISLQGTIDLRGLNGTPHASVGAGGGGGGGLYMEGASLEVGGNIYLMGGDGGGGASYPQGGSGGGGRAAFKSPVLTVTGNISVAGGGPGDWPYYHNGQPGSVVYFPAGGLWVRDPLSLDAQAFSFSQIRVTYPGALTVNAGTTITAASVLLELGGELRLNDGAFNLNGPLNIGDSALCSIVGRSLTTTALTMGSSSHLELRSGAWLRAPTASLSPAWIYLYMQNAGLSVPDLVLGSQMHTDLEGSLLVSDSDIRVQGGGEAVAIRGVVEFHAQRFLLESGALLDGNLRGYGQNQGPCAPYNPWSGAAHGGPGGKNGFLGGGFDSGGCDNPLNPALPGSGGSSFPPYTNAGLGGACVRVIASSGAALSGTVSVNAGNASTVYDYAGTHDAGGGSGGAIYVSAPTIWGHGFLSAKGGEASGGTYGGGGGSGGLIYLDSGGGACGLALSYNVDRGHGAWGSGGGTGGDGSMGLFGTSCPPTPTPSQTPSSTISPTYTATPSITETATESPTFSASPTASPTPTVSATPSASPSASATATPVLSATPSPAFRQSGLAEVQLGPVPVRRGEPLCAWFPSAPASSQWRLFNSAGELVMKASFGAEFDHCVGTNALAPGFYLVLIETIQPGGTVVRTRHKVVVLGG